VVEHRVERAEEIWGPISEQAHRRRGREMNDENMKRVKKLRFE
jgi:hypothetical protein